MDDAASPNSRLAELVASALMGWVSPGPAPFKIFGIYGQPAVVRLDHAA